MTRKGKLPISVPNGVEVQIQEGDITVKGPKGTLKQDVVPGIVVKSEEGNIFVSTREDIKNMENFHGLYRTLIENLVIGVSKGFDIKLEMIGVGYRAAVQGSDLNLFVGFSHPTLLPIPEGIQAKVEKNTNITISGADKQKVGQFAATIRRTRPPEPYQGKGIRYQGEYVRKKAGKAAASKK
jgi:large subunit ribosomal protein L6